jgi:hypothetical protein
LSHELARFGTGLFSLGFSPIQKTVVTMLLFQGYRSLRLGGGGDENIRANKPPLTLADASLNGLSDFLVNFILGGSAFSGSEWAKTDEIDDNKAAIV